MADSRQIVVPFITTVDDMTSPLQGFRLLPMPASFLDRARRETHDAGDGSRSAVTATGGEPVRCCRRDAESGEALVLASFAPPLPGPPSPYQETGAVFVHASCEGTRDEGYPPDWRARPQVLRAYDDRGWIHPATRVHDGNQSETVLMEVLSEPGVVEVHSRNIAYGCWMFTAVRAETQPRVADAVGASAGS